MFKNNILSIIYCLTAAAAAALLSAAPARAVHLEWSQSYNSASNGTDYGFGIDSDNGYLYLTGQSDGDIWVSKYDIDGANIWSKTYGSGGGLGISLDAGGDNMYVSGFSGSGIWFGKLDSAGTVQWTKTPATGYGFDTVVDNSGDIVVTGYTKSETCTVWTRKYDPAGSTLWTQTFSSSPSLADESYAVAVDSSDNVYVAGRVNGAAFNYDLWVRRYDSGGAADWTDNPTSTLDERCNDIVLDADGNVFVTGWSDTQIMLRKYDSAGTLLWSDTSQTGKGRGLAVDAGGNVIVCGDSGGDIWLGKFDTGGALLWDETYDGAAHEEDRAYGVTLDGDGDIYVTGFENHGIPGQGWDALLLKYSEVDVPEPVADFSLDIEPLGNGKGDYYPVMFPFESVHLFDESENMGTDNDEWFWEIIDATDHTSVVATSDLQNSVFGWNDLAGCFDEPFEDHWYDVRLTVTNSAGSDTHTEQYRFMSTPEPGTIVLVCSALAGLAVIARKTRA